MLMPWLASAVKRCWEQACSCRHCLVCCAVLAAARAWLWSLPVALCDLNPSALQPQLAWRNQSDSGENCQKHLSGLVSVVSLLSMTHLLRSPSPHKDNVLFLPVQPIASEKFTIKNPGWWRFAWFIRLWWLLFAFLLFFLLPTHSNLNFLDHFSSVNSQLLSCKPPCTITVRV